MKRLFLLCIMACCLANMLTTAQNLVPVEDPRTGLYGYKQEGSDKWVVKPKFYIANHFREGLAVVIKKKGIHTDEHGSMLCPKYFAGYIDETGKIVIPLKFEWTNDFHEGLAVVKVWDDTSIFRWRFGYIDTSGRFVVPPIYDSADDFRNGRAHVRWYDEYGFCWETYIDEFGREGERRQVGNSRLPEGQTRPRWR
jgi:hypothetical protein